MAVMPTQIKMNAKNVQKVGVHLGLNERPLLLFSGDGHAPFCPSQTPCSTMQGLKHITNAQNKQEQKQKKQKTANYHSIRSLS